MTIDFKSKQLEFSAYVRDPFNNARPIDVNLQRMEIYRELFFNNIEGILSSNFPVLKAIFDQQSWFELCQNFCTKHSCSTPYFYEIAEEFLAYLENKHHHHADFPFLLELAHYEWVEMALAISTQEMTPNAEEFIADLSQQNITLSALAWPLVYQYPVHEISPDFLPKTQPQAPTFLLVYRDVFDEVNFIQISPLTFRLTQLLQENKPQPSDFWLNKIAEESTHPEPHIIMAAGLEAITELAVKNIILRAK